jgi:hypothetical protein
MYDAISAFPEARLIRINDSAIDHLWLPCIRRLGSTERMEIVSATVDAEILYAIAKLPRVMSLVIADVRLPNDSCRILSRSSAIQVLSLGACCLDGGCYSAAEFDEYQLTWLSDIVQLRELNLRATPLSDTGIGSLLLARNLQTLDIGDTAVTDVGVLKLAKIKSLRVLNLAPSNPASQAAISNTTVTRLRSLRPDMTVMLGSMTL